MENRYKSTKMIEDAIADGHSLTLHSPSGQHDIDKIEAIDAIQMTRDDIRISGSTIVFGTGDVCITIEDTPLLDIEVKTMEKKYIVYRNTYPEDMSRFNDYGEAVMCAINFSSDATIANETTGEILYVTYKRGSTQVFITTVNGKVRITESK